MRSLKDDQGRLVQPPVHTMFGLSYANYLVMPRVVLQQMPLDWQKKFVRLMAEYQEAVESVKFPASFAVTCQDTNGKFIKDTFPHYRHGRVELREKS